MIKKVLGILPNIVAQVYDLAQVSSSNELVTLAVEILIISFSQFPDCIPVECKAKYFDLITSHLRLIRNLRLSISTPKVAPDVTTSTTNFRSPEAEILVSCRSGKLVEKWLISCTYNYFANFVKEISLVQQVSLLKYLVEYVQLHDDPQHRLWMLRAVAQVFQDIPALNSPPVVVGSIEAQKFDTPTETELSRHSSALGFSAPVRPVPSPVQPEISQVGSLLKLTIKAACESTTKAMTSLLKTTEEMGHLKCIVSILKRIAVIVGTGGEQLLQTVLEAIASRILQENRNQVPILDGGGANQSKANGKSESEGKEQETEDEDDWDDWDDEDDDGDGEGAGACGNNSSLDKFVADFGDLLCTIETSCQSASAYFELQSLLPEKCRSTISWLASVMNSRPQKT